MMKRREGKQISVVWHRAALKQRCCGNTKDPTAAAIAPHTHTLLPLTHFCLTESHHLLSNTHTHTHTHTHSSAPHTLLSNRLSNAHTRLSNRQPSPPLQPKHSQYESPAFSCQCNTHTNTVYVYAYSRHPCNTLVYTHKCVRTLILRRIHR